MSTFPNISASYGITKRSKPNIRSVAYGDGYVARLNMGLNQNPKTWNPVWENITETDADTIETFLDARAADADPFTWTPPNESSASKFVCDDWSKQINIAGFATISATFTEVFEP